jgi:two-component system, chemotaxis family, sensor kinase CheA
VDDLTREFLLESQEGLDRMERALTDLETRPGDTELIADIFRTVHTIKGTTGFLGFGRLEALSHAGENLLGLLRDAVLAATPDVISGLLSLMDMLRAILHTIEATGSDGESEQQDTTMIRRLEALQLPGASVAVDPPETAEVVVVAAHVAASGKRRASRKRNPHRTLPADPLLDAPPDSPPPPEKPTGPLADGGEPLREVESESRSGLGGSPAEVVSSPSAWPVKEPSPQTNVETAPAAASGTADSTLRVDVELLTHLVQPTTRAEAAAR